MPPAPGMIASLVSGRPRTHPSDPTLEAVREGEVDRVRRLRGGRSGGEGTAHLRSQERASSKPPPRATPPTAAMVGTGSLCSARKDARRRFTKATTSSSPIARRSFRSAPFEKKKTGRVKRFQCHVSSPVFSPATPIQYALRLTCAKDTLGTRVHNNTSYCVVYCQLTRLYNAVFQVCQHIMPQRVSALHSV